MAQKHRRKPWHRLQTHLPKILAALVTVAVLAGGAYFVTKKSPQDHLKAGIALHQSGDFKGAAIELKNVLQGAPTNGEARYLLGHIHFANGDYLAAEKELKKARDLAFKTPDLEPLYARTLLLINQPQRILDEIKAGDSETPETHAALLALRARAHLLLKDPANAEKELAEADARSTDHPETLVSRAYLALTQKNPNGALAYTEQALIKADKRADLWVMQGDLLRMLKRNDAALSAYAKAVAIEPSNIPARLASAQLLLAEAAFDKAEAELKTLHKYAPNNVMGRYLDAFIEFRRSNFAEADAKLQEVLRSAPNFLPANLLGGAVKLAMGNREAARFHLDKVLNAAPQHPLARKLMAATLADMGDVTQAKKILDSFENVGNDPILNSLQGELALRRGDYAEARKHLEKMGADSPQNPKYFTELAASRMGTGDDTGAIEALTKAAELDTASAKPDVLLVLAHLKEKRFDEALKVVEKLEKERPNDPLIHNLRGTIAISREDKALARASFAKALQIQPSYFPAASNLALLDVQDKDSKAARSRFEQLLKQAPAENRAWLALAALDAREKNEAGYLKNLEQAKKANSKSVQAHHLLARYWLEKRNGGKALSAAREGLDATGRIEFQEFIGLAQLLQKDQASALATFTRWAEVSFNNPMAHFRLAQVQIAAKDDAAALKSLDKALALRADFVDANVNKALLLGRMGRSADAIKIARSVQAGAPKVAAGYLAEAEVLFQDKKYPNAGKLFAQAAQIAGQGQPLARAYQAYAAAGQPAEGEKLLDQWLKAHPADTVVRHALAQAQLNGKRLQEAADNYRVLARTNPRDLVALNNLAWLLGELKNPEALSVAEQAFKLAPKESAVMDTYGVLLSQTGQHARAIELLRKALKDKPEDMEIRWHLASALVNAGDTAGAVDELDRIIASKVDFAHLKEAHALLTRLGGRKQ